MRNSGKVDLGSILYIVRYGYDICMSEGMVRRLGYAYKTGTTQTMYNNMLLAIKCTRLHRIWSL